GSTAGDVVKTLDEAGLINSDLCAKVYVKLHSPDVIKANTYSLDKNMNLPTMFDIISKGTGKYVVHTKITIIEGSTIPQVADDVSAVSGVSKNEVINKWGDKEYLKELIDKYWFLTDEILAEDIKYPLEGYLYPETYFVPGEDVTIEGLTEQFLDMTDQKLSEIKDDMKKSNFTTHELLTFSSLVESEANFDEDIPKIAGVFMNRLRDNMKLQCDSTVLYALGKKHIDVSIDETTTKDPYNTYTEMGLPPGPICATLADTVEDCINYEHSDYKFFFATEDGTVLYTKTYDEHQKVVKENKWY
ncbi:MAG: endolytic transglycosylase MltG, partial [Firmicutes bacterium]|nr:endolytic transglycosylase MltG [Bacillota bacterium]